MRIFISYRRSDSAYAAGILANRIQDRFGEDSVFMDVDDIPLGVDFRQHILYEVARCNVLLVLIGDSWISISDDHGKRRIDDPNDYVRLEIGTALSRDIPVIPILLGNASLPKVNELPSQIKPLAFRNAAEVRSGRDLWRHVESVIEYIELQKRTIPNKSQVQRTNLQRLTNRGAGVSSVTIMGDKSADKLADFLRSKSVNISAPVDGVARNIVLVFEAVMIDANHVTELLISIVSKSTPDLLCVILDTDRIDDFEMLDIIEDEIRDQMSTYQFNGKDVPFFHYPQDSIDLVNFLLTG